MEESDIVPASYNLLALFNKMASYFVKEMQACMFTLYMHGTALRLIACKLLSVE